MAKEIKRNKAEMAAYFKMLQEKLETEAHRNGNDPYLIGKAEAYGLAAFELEHNME